MRFHTLVLAGFFAVFLGCQSARIQQSQFREDELRSLCAKPGEFRAEFWVTSQLKQQKKISFPASFLERDDGSWVFQAQDLFGNEMLTLIYGRSYVEVRSNLPKIESQTVSVGEMRARLPSALQWVSDVKEDFAKWLRGGVFCKENGVRKLAFLDPIETSTIQAQPCPENSAKSLCLVKFKTAQGVSVTIDDYDRIHVLPQAVQITGAFGDLKLKVRESQFKEKNESEH